MTDLAITGPVGVRRFVLEDVCQVNHGHAHNYDHTTFVHRGRLRISVMKALDDGTLREQSFKDFDVGSFAAIPAGVIHRLKAMEPNTVYLCLFSHRDFDGLVTQQYVGNEQSYV